MQPLQELLCHHDQPQTCCLTQQYMAQSIVIRVIFHHGYQRLKYLNKRLRTKAQFLIDVCSVWFSLN